MVFIWVLTKIRYKINKIPRNPRDKTNISILKIKNGKADLSFRHRLKSKKLYQIKRFMSIKWIFKNHNKKSLYNICKIVYNINIFLYVSHIYYMISHVLYIFIKQKLVILWYPFISQKLSFNSFFLIEDHTALSNSLIEWGGGKREVLRYCFDIYKIFDIY